MLNVCVGYLLRGKSNSRPTLRPTLNQFFVTFFRWNILDTNEILQKATRRIYYNKTRILAHKLQNTNIILKVIPVILTIFLVLTRCYMKIKKNSKKSVDLFE